MITFEPDPLSNWYIWIIHAQYELNESLCAVADRDYLHPRTSSTDVSLFDV